jgi:hypothetical protein
MRRLVTGLLLAAALAGTAAAAQPARVLAVEWEAGGGKMRWVSPTTLRPAGPAVLNVGGAPANLVAVSPDGALAAIGGGANGRLRLVRLDGLRPGGLMWLGEGSVFKGIWASPERLVVLLGGVHAEVVAVDPAARTVLHREKLQGLALGAVRAGDRLLTLLAPSGRVGPARLAVIDADGTVRTTALRTIEAGFGRPATPGRARRQASPGLATDGTRAFVLGVDRLVEVDLESLAVRSERIVTRTTTRETKLVHGWGRSAVWLRGDTVAYSGWTSSDAMPPAATGVFLLDVATGEARMLDRWATDTTRAGRTLLVYGRDELRGYRLDGSRRFTLQAGTDTGYVQVAGHHAYVGSHNSTRFTIVDVEQARVVGRARTAKPTVLLAP